MAERSASKGGSIRLIFMGMGGRLSSAPLNVLLQAGYQFSAVVIAAASRQTGWRPLPHPGQAKHGEPPMASQPRSIVQLAWDYGIPLFEAGNLQASGVQDALQQLAPDVVLVSCFPHHVPASLLRLPQQGFWNLHPSRLPAYRGPYPLFWQLRDGLSQIGLTVLRLDEGLDTGPIARQASVALEDGMSAVEIEQRVGSRGGQLFDEAVRALAAGELSFEAQQGNGSYQGPPKDSDFSLHTHWSARRAFNFMRGTAEWGRPYAIEAGERRWLLRRALAYHPAAVQSAPVQETRQRIKIQFNPGILEAL